LLFFRELIGLAKEFFDIVIIGGGVAGFAAAMYAGRFNMKTAVVAENWGGTIVLTDTVENYPGFKKLSGQELADKIKAHALEYGVKLVQERVTAVERCGESYRVVHAKGSLETKTFVFATGTKWRKLGVKGEDEYASKGVHYCALCDGYFYKGKNVVIVGGGDSAAKESLTLAGLAGNVTILVRGPELKAEPVNLERVKAAKNVSVRTNVSVQEVKGNGKNVTSVVLKTDGGVEELAIDGVFVEIGHLPVSELAVQLGVKVDKKNEIMIDRLSKTNLDGVYACGDVADSPFKQAITGVGEAVNAAYSAYQYVSSKTILPCGERNGSDAAATGKGTHPPLAKPPAEKP